MLNVLDHMRIRARCRQKARGIVLVENKNTTDLRQMIQPIYKHNIMSIVTGSYIKDASMYTKGVRRKIR